MKKFASVFSATVGLALAAGLGYVFWQEYGLWAIAVWVAMVAAFPVSSAFHELGHMLLGAAVKLKAVPKLSLFNASSCEIIPKTDKNLRVRLIIAVSGGLIFNALPLILGIIAFAVPAVPLWLALFMPANGYLYVLNAMPAELAGGKTDGLVRAELLGNTDLAKVMVAVLTVQAQVLGGKPIKYVDKGLLFDLPQICEDEAAFISLTELRYEYYEALDKPKKAEFYKKRLEELKKEYT